LVIWCITFSCYLWCWRCENSVAKCSFGSFGMQIRITRMDFWCAFWCCLVAEV
jgi:hypothetical protein